MRRWILRPWLQMFVTSRGTPSCSGSGWLSAWASHPDNWRAMSGLAKESPPRRTTTANQAESCKAGGQQATPGAAVTSAARYQEKALRAVTLLERFLDDFETTTPVSFIRSVGVPTAMSWMRRRGPDVPHAVLYRLFRQRQIRLFDGDKVRRVSASRPLENGDLLLFPNWLVSGKQLRNQQQQKQQFVRKLDPGARATAAVTAAAAIHQSDQYDGMRDDAGGPAGHDGVAAATSGARVHERNTGDSVRQLSHDAAGPGPGSCRDVEAETGEAARWMAPAALAAGAGVTAQSAMSSQLRNPQGQPQQLALVLTPERVRRWVLAVHPGLLFLNKPAGVRVHGRAAGDEPNRGWGHRGRPAGGGMRPPVPVTLDDMMHQALRYGEADEPRLVHRLDQAASGVMVVARNADAATWLCAAFRGKAEQALADGKKGEEEEEKDEEEGNGEEDDGSDKEFGGGRRGGARARRREVHLRTEERPSIHRTYWAFLAGELQPRQSGRISLPVVVDGVACPAVTAYRVKATGCGISWVELTPETGRRHQLRVHCARKLGAPIIGDERYGYRGLPPRLMLRDRLPPEWWALLGDDPRVVRRSHEAAGEVDPLPPPVLLHSRELVVKRPGKAAVAAVAPLPRYIRQLIEAAGWPVPSVG
ncbi:hypothetical protein Vretimale_4306 [Volvox reticuliferus]|uniref:Pseudouridine synthase RsuA/RluA-like domain-containing protein n=1 Tax=Volvox reticuliferus TaxID=1737510 RepID=A0A8J4C689_9CHLO|nr:hypothetical protein Vretifemale_2883 [Volvox reticuliferus]GIL99013.1 hypothetical protein Vretimale_4306 [Volvox reticuliferus]